MGLPGPLEMILILLVVLLVFGAKRIPEIARGIGQGIREFKSATDDIKNEIEREGSRQQIDPQPPRQGTPQPREQASSAQREPAHQEAGRPASADDGPAEPSRADNPGEEREGA